jgi:protein-ribulosamine 3-kinase
LKSAYILDEVAVLLSEQWGKEVQLVKTTGIGGGCIHNATRLETTEGIFFLKWNENCAPDLFIREAECLREIKQANPDPLLIPEVIMAREANTLPGFLVLEYLESGAVSNADELLGRGLAQLHRHTGSKFGFHHHNYCGSTLQLNNWNDSWPDFYAHQRIGELVHRISSERGWTPEHRRLFDRMIGKIPQLLPQTSVPVLIHGDLWAGNYMITRNGPALIDPASYYADREMEMGIMTLFGGFSDRFWAAYNEVLPLMPGWKERNKIYQLYHLLNHFLLFGGGYGNSAINIANYFAG